MSPTVNFTNATGSFTYTEGSGPTPPDPPDPPVNTYGKIENFTAVNGEYFKMDGRMAGVNTTNHPWCLNKQNDYTLRFEVRSGDVWAASGGSYQDSGCERCEIGFQDYDQCVNEGVMMNWEGEVTVLAGPVSTGDWMTILQSHATTNVSPTYAPFSLNIQKNTDKLQVVLEEPKQSGNNYVYTSPKPIVRDKPMRLRTKVKMGPTGNGYVGVWWDDEQIVDFNGKVGATNSQYYWKYGAYRGLAREAFKIDFKNVHITTG